MPAYFVGDFSSGLCRIEVYEGNTKYTGFINKSYAVVIKGLTYDRIWDFHDGLCAVGRKKAGGFEFGFMDLKGNISIPMKFKAVSNFSDGVSSVKDKNGKMGVINKNGKYIVEPKYEMISHFGNGYAFLVETTPDLQIKKVGFLNNKGTVTMPLTDRFSGVLYFSEGVFGVKMRKEEKWGYVDSQGTIIIPPKYEEAGQFSEGLSAVKSGGKFGFINKTGNFVITPRFENVSNHDPEHDDIAGFRCGIAKVISSGKTVFINTSGAIVYKVNK